MTSGYFLIFRLICLNLNLNLVRNQVQTREELKNYLVIPMLTVSCSRPVELDQTISSIILQFKNPESYQTVARLTCIGGKRHILQTLHRFMTHLVSTILVLGPCDFKLDLELQTCIYEKIGLNLVNGQKKSRKLGQQIALIGQKMPQLKMFRFFMFFLQFKSWFFMFFLGNSNHAWITFNYLSPCHKMIFEYEVIVWMETSQIYSVIS